MYRIRPVSKEDLSALLNLAEHTEGGLISLYPNIDMLKNRIEHSIKSFSKEITNPGDEKYLFALENNITKEVIGTTSIQATIGSKHPYTTYKVIKKSGLSEQISIKTEYEQLILVNEHQGKTEICALYLNHKLRGKQLGSLLSRSRFLFIAQFPHRFSPDIIASMRGIYDSSTGSPFWNNLGKKFIPISMEKASYLAAVINRQFITDLLPHQAIPIPLLSKSAQRSIGKVHSATKPAMHILEKEGFAQLGSVHPLDGGPIIESPLKNIHTIKSCQTAQVSNISAHIGEQAPEYLVSNCQLNFYAAYGQVVQINRGYCEISEELSQQLQVKIGDIIQFVKA